MASGHAYAPRSYHPAEIKPCDNPDSYTCDGKPCDNKGLLRSACNNVASDYWLGDDKDVGWSGGYKVHRRGSIVFGALYRFQRRFLDGGYGWLLPGPYMYQAQKVLSEPEDDESIYLDQLLGLLAATPTAEHNQLAQVAFAEKNVFPNDATSKTQYPCNEDKESALNCHGVALWTLSVAAPLNAEQDKAPTFDVFAPQGTRYDPVVKIDLSTHSQLAALGGNDLVYHFWMLSGQPQVNNSPLGFFRVRLADNPEFATGRSWPRRRSPRIPALRRKPGRMIRCG